MNQNNYPVSDSTYYFSTFAWTWSAAMGVVSFFIGKEHYQNKNKALSYIGPILKNSGFLSNEYNDYNEYDGYYKACAETLDYVINSVPQIIEKTVTNTQRWEASDFNIPIYRAAAESISDVITQESPVGNFISKADDKLLSAMIYFKEKVIASIAPYIVQNIEESKSMSKAYYTTLYSIVDSPAIAMLFPSDQTLANASCNLTGLLCEPATNSEYSEL